MVALGEGFGGNGFGGGFRGGFWHGRNVGIFAHLDTRVMPAAHGIFRWSLL
jgi:hypothetical protein